MRKQLQCRNFVIENLDTLYEMSTTDVMGRIIKFIDPAPSPIDYTKATMLERYWGDVRYEVEEWREYRRDAPVPNNENMRYYTDQMLYRLFQYISQTEKQLIQAKHLDPNAAVRQCPICNGVAADAMYEGDKKKLKLAGGMCTACFQRQFYECHACKEYHPTEIIFQTIVDHKHVPICPPCKERYYMKCPQCKQLIRKTAFRFKVIHGEEIKCCSHCIKNLTRKCASCGKKYQNVNRNTFAQREGHLCDRCLHDAKPYCSHLYKPTELVFHTHMSEQRKPDTLFFGLELEIELDEYRGGDRVDFSLAMKKKYPFDTLYMVWDGSLQYGIEAVMQPFSEMWYRYNKKALAGIYKTVFYNGGTFAGRKVGFHVHTSKAAWMPTQVYKLIKFLYDREHHEIFKKFYGRTPNTHSRKEMLEYRQACKVAKSGKNADDSHHYNMVNLSCGATIEFRMFKGAETIEDLYRYMDFIRCIHEFTAKYSIKSMNMSMFSVFVCNDRRWAALTPYFKEV